MKNQLYDFSIFLNSVNDLGIAFSRKPLNLKEVGEKSGIIIKQISCSEADVLFEMFLHKYCYSFFIEEYGLTILFFDPLFSQQYQILDDILEEIMKIETSNEN